MSAQVVLASGDIVVANENENPDLFWAIRGITLFHDELANDFRRRRKLWCRHRIRLPIVPPSSALLVRHDTV